MHAEAEYVGVIALFRSPGKETVWKLVVPKKQWKKTDPVRIEVRGSTLELVGASFDGPGGVDGAVIVRFASTLRNSEHVAPHVS